MGSFKEEIRELLDKLPREEFIELLNEFDFNFKDNEDKVTYLNVIDKLKQKHKLKASEELFGFTEPPDYQCPSIDQLINNLDKVKEEAQYNRYDDYDDLKNRLDEIIYYLGDYADRLEEIRTNIQSLRLWGQQWKDLAKEIINNENINLNGYLIYRVKNKF